MEEPTLLVTLIISLLMMCLLLAYSFRHRDKRGVRFFAWVMVCRVVFACCVILELSSSDESLKLLFRHFQQTALAFTVPFVVLCLIDLYAKDEWLQKWKITALFSVFAVWSILIWLDPHTHWIHEQVTMVNEMLVVTKTPFSIGFNIICYLILMTCVYFFILYIWKSNPKVRKPGIIVIALALIPFGLEIVKLSFPHWIHWLLPISVYCSIVGVIMLWFIYKSKMFSIVPMARSFIVDAIQEGILTVDPRGKIMDSNAFVSTLLKEEKVTTLLGKDIQDTLKRWPEWVKACQEMHEVSFEISVAVHEDINTYIVKVYPLHSGRRSKMGTVSILFDVTEKQRQLEEIARLHLLKNQLFTLVSHDIREPIATQVSLIEMLESDQESLSEESKEIMNLLSHQIRNTYMTVGNFMEWFRGQKEDSLLNPEIADVSELIEEAYRLLHIKSMSKNVQVKVSLEGSLSVLADRETMIMVIRNLLSNAIKFSHRGGIVHIEAMKKQDKVTLAIRDNGVGMTPDQITQLYEERTLKSMPGTEGEKGTGLGLQVSRQFIMMNNGDFWIESERGKGSCFYFTLESGD